MINKAIFTINEIYQTLILTQMYRMAAGKTHLYRKAMMYDINIFRLSQYGTAWMPAWTYTYVMPVNGIMMAETRIWDKAHSFIL